mmetsp:Transcript_24930/g.84015  ORF Transcript_24930/g.84015 Transcript_24930/m.84015 type:complete len:183 (-) Transcript_24930:133-681(-)
MGGRYPSSKGQRCECNFCAAAWGGIDHRAAAQASAHVVERLPASVDVVFSGLEVGLRVVTGAALSTCAPAASPLRQAYVDYGGGVDRGRFSWDLITTHVAAAGGLPGVRRCSDCGGVNVVDASTGANAWRRGPAANQTYLVLEDAAAAQRVIDRLLCQPPRLGASAPNDVPFAAFAREGPIE